MDRFPLLSLKALHTFSVASRYLNFSKAATELFITPSAVSHQIKRLEESLGCQLFEKKGTQLYLTPDAQLYSIVLNQCFEQIHDATRTLTGYKKNVIQIGVDAAFAVQRLTPELGLWQESHPDLDLRVRMVSCEDNLAELDLDVIFSRKISHALYDSTQLATEKYYPVCSRTLAIGIGSKNLAQIISSHALIDLSDVDGWRLWHQVRGSQMSDTSRVIYFSHTLLMIQAALSGQGIALLEKTLIKNELDTGELVLLENEGFVPVESRYYFSSHKRRKGDRNITTLKNWIAALFL